MCAFDLSKCGVKNATMTARRSLAYKIVETPAGVQRTVQQSIDDDERSFCGYLLSKTPTPKKR